MWKLKVECVEIEGGVYGSWSHSVFKLKPECVEIEAGVCTSWRWSVWKFKVECVEVEGEHYTLQTRYVAVNWYKDSIFRLGLCFVISCCIFLNISTVVHHHVTVLNTHHCTHEKSCVWLSHRLCFDQPINTTLTAITCVPVSAVVLVSRKQWCVDVQGLRHDLYWYLASTPRFILMSRVNSMIYIDV